MDPPDKGSNGSYEQGHIIESFWLSIWTGASRYIHAAWLCYYNTPHNICTDEILSYIEGRKLNYIVATRMYPNVKSDVYGLMSLFRHFALQQHNKATLATLKVYCLALGARPVNHANIKMLKTALNVKRRPWPDGIFAKIENMCAPFQYSNA